MTASLTAPAAPADEISAYIAASTKAAWDVDGPAGRHAAEADHRRSACSAPARWAAASR